MRICFRLLLCLFSVRLVAQMPSECLLIINGRSLQAMEIAHHYAELRHFPAERILILNPDPAFFRNADGSARWTVPEADARDTLLTPVLEKLKELADPSPTALILSPEWPTRVTVTGSPQVSMTGFLGARGDLPAADLIKNGQAISPWFSPPPDSAAKQGRLLRYPLQGEMTPAFHPAAMLGVYYPPLNTEKMLAHLKRASDGDFRQPIASIVFETNADVRSRARLGQFQLAQTRLQAKGVDTVIMPRSDPAPKKILGVMAGAANINAQKYAPGLVAGSFANHLTSFAANFDTSDQSKLTLWLDAGAAASVGTVTEPNAIWMKFPEAAFFERYLRGNSLLESLMQSLASPYQCLIVGDPLCRPWADELKNLDVKTSWTEGKLTVKALGVPTGSGTSLHLFLDGRRIPGNGPIWTLDTSAETYGPEMDLLLHARYFWAPPELGVLTKRIISPYPEMLQLKAGTKADHVILTVKSKVELMFLEVFRGTEIVHSTSVSGKKTEVALGLDESGTGPVHLRVRGVSRQGDIIFSNYVDLSPSAP
jgi:hypothetical protein